MHWPAQDAPLEEYWQVFVDLKQAGKVRAIGLSNHDAKQLEAAEAMGHVDTLQPPFSAINRAVGAAELPWCLEHGTAVIVYSPMQSGLLAGRFSKERVAGLPADDWRSHDPDFNTPAIDRNLAVVEAMRPIAARHGVEVAAVAVAWALAWPAVTGAIVGARSPAQAAGWLPAAELELSGTDLAEIASVIRRTGAGVGPVAP
jgi:aryl-alcohol dehydrogenase-like predicted oxidoreductase